MLKWIKTCGHFHNCFLYQWLNVPSTYPLFGGMLPKFELWRWLMKSRKRWDNGKTGKYVPGVLISISPSLGVVWPTTLDWPRGSGYGKCKWEQSPQQMRPLSFFVKWCDKVYFQDALFFQLLPHQRIRINQCVSSSQGLNVVWEFLWLEDHPA